MVRWPPGLDYESTPSYTVTLTLLDNGAEFSSSATLTVNVIDEEDPPELLVQIDHKLSVALSITNYFDLTDYIN